MNRWTDQQLNAIEAKGCSVIVSAAAGSGKTSVLVERLIRIISDNQNQVPVESMIVVTFTKDAAAEMKMRLSTALSRMIESEPENTWLTRQSSMLDCAAISTISSFCIELLRNNICQLSFSPGFMIADETEEKLLKAEAYKNTSDFFYKHRNEDMLKLRGNFCTVSDDRLETLIYELYDSVSSVPFFGLWLSEAEKKYDSDIYEKLYHEYLKKDVKTCEAVFDRTLSAVNRLGNEKVADMFMSEKDSFDNAAEKFRANDIQGFCQALRDIRFERFPRIKKDDDQELKDTVAQYRDNYKELISKLTQKASVYSHSAEDMEKNREILKIISDFLRMFSEELMQLKENKNELGFDDAESLVLSLLAEVDENGKIEKTPLAEELSEYYSLIMIDEFQDSNNRQDMIFRLLSKGGSAEKYGSNLFFVGDVKQSIYRFRLANPDNFIAALENSVPYQKGCTENSHVRLSKNFRSSQEVIDFSNYIFSRIMSRGCGDIDYTSEEYLYRGANFCESERKPVIMLFDRKSEMDETAEARYVAARIAQMLHDGTPVSINGGKDSRPCEMRDFCILTRGNKKISIYANELEKLGISAESGTQSGYLKAREVTILINLLRVTDNPLLDTPLVSVMMSPMFMFTPDETAEIRLIDKKAHIYTNICKGLGIDASEPLFKDELLAKAQNLHSIITELRLYSGACTLQELIRKIYDRTDFMSVMQLYGGAEKKKANLRMMLEYAGNYEKNSDSGLSGFVRYIDRILESGGDLNNAPEPLSSDNIVSIKTMHRSKGLEFPFVFIVGTWSRFNQSDSAKPFQFSYDLGLGFRLQDPEKFERYPTISSEVIGVSNRLAFIGEEMRLLYVAMTRAKERLFITLDCGESAAKKARSFAGTISAQDGITPELAASASSMSDWLLMCLVSHEKSGRLRELFSIYECFTYSGVPDLEYCECSATEAPADEIKVSDSKRKESDPEMIRELEKMFAFSYDLSLSALTANLSVSDISKGSDINMPLKRPDFAKAEKGLTPSEKGTAMHTFLQFANFSALEKDVNPELQRLYEKGFLTKKEADSIDPENVRKFLDSELYSRIKKCDNVRRERKFRIAIAELDPGGALGEEYKNTSGLLSGIIDIVLDYGNHLVIADYKTDRVSDINELAERYHTQLTLYKKALEKIEARPVTETIIYSFHKKSEICLK